jgi:hypothetical protein
MLPALPRILLYAAASGWLGMHLYRRFSDQAALRELRSKVQASQRALALHEGDFAQLQTLIRSNMLLSLRQVGLTLRPALLASLPLLFVMPWLSNRFAIEPPTPGTPVKICAEPAASANLLHWRPAIAASAADDACWHVATPDSGSQVELLDSGEIALLQLPQAYVSSVRHQYIWLNALIGNPAGYLPESSAVYAITLDLPSYEVVHLGPDWMRGWECWYFFGVIVVSIWLKLRWRLS